MNRIKHLDGMNRMKPDTDEPDQVFGQDKQDEPDQVFGQDKQDEPDNDEPDQAFRRDEPDETGYR